MSSIDYTKETAAAGTASANDPTPAVFLVDDKSTETFFRSRGSGALGFSVKNLHGSNVVTVSVRASNFLPSEHAITDWPVVVAAADVAGGAIGAFGVAQAQYLYYAVLLESKVDDTHANCRVRCVQKAV